MHNSFSQNDCAGHHAAEEAQMNFKIGELFCGPGGLSLGAMRSSVEKNGEQYAISHAWANDFDEDSCETYRQNIAQDFVICRAVEQLDFSSLSPIDILAFGFPCNDFSVVGKKRGINGVYGPSLVPIANSHRDILISQRI